MKRRQIIWIAVAVLVILSGLRIMNSKKKDKAVDTDTGKPVYVREVTRGAIQTVVKLSGNIVPSLEADVFSRVTGKLLNNLVQDGDYVEKNQGIILIDRDEVGLRFTTATVKSPIKGVLLKHYLDYGETVNPMMPVATVGDISRVKVVVYVPENDFVKIKRGSKVNIKVDAYPNRSFYGEIVQVAPEIDIMSRTGKAEIIVDNEGNALKPGMLGTVTVVLQSHSGVIVIPRTSVIEDGDKRTAFVFDNGKAIEKTLRIGMYDDDNAEVLDGLQQSELLIVEGNRRINNGDAVRRIQE